MYYTSWTRHLSQGISIDMPARLALQAESRTELDALPACALDYRTEVQTLAIAHDDLIVRGDIWGEWAGQV
jgi:hypothetical protein